MLFGHDLLHINDQDKEPPNLEKVGVKLEMENILLEFH